MKTNLKILFFAIVFFLFLGINFDINIYDEGIALVGASNILNGKLPYLDFWTIYSPGWFFILSAWIAVFGKQILLIRLGTAIVNVINILIFYYLIKKETKQEFISLYLCISLMGLISINPFYARNVPFAITLILLGFLLLLSKLKYKYFYLGILSGLLFFIRHDFAFYFCLILGSFWLFQLLFKQSKISLKEIFAFLTSFVSLIILWIFLLSTFNMLDGFIQDAILFPIQHFRETRSLPFPNPFEIITNPEFSYLTKGNKIWETFVFYFPFSVLALFVLLLILKGKSNNTLNEFSTFSILATIFLSIQAFNRSDVEHIIPSFYFSLLVFGKLVENLTSQRKILIFALLIFLAIPPIIKKMNNLSYLIIPGKSVELASNYGKWIRIPSEFSYYNDLLNFISIKCSKGNFFSGSKQHDRIYINDVMIYYLIGELPPTKFYELHPGIATTPLVQNRIIEELQREKVECIVLYESNIIEKQNYKGSKILDDFIHANFEQIKIFGKYYFLVKKQLIVKQ